jgi:DNA modification methylase
MKKAMTDYMKKPKSDHFSTPDYAIEPLLKYINPDWTVWEPADTNGKSRISHKLRMNGNVVRDTNFDFLKKTPDFCFDCVVTNPPYSIKDDFIFRAMTFRKPFAFLLPLTALEGVRRGSMYRVMGKKFGVLVLDRRVEFTGGSVWFNTSWFCYGLLPEQLIFAELEK